MFGLLNIGSLVLGLLAWILPMVNLTRYKKQNHKNWLVFSVISISACAISLCFQILYNYYLVRIEDWSALMDTMGTIAFSTTVLLIVTFILNAITLKIYRDRLVK
jgi:cytochrome c oxidase subunit 4